MFKNDLFSQRKKLEAGFPDVYTYDQISSKLNNQIAHIIKGAIGSSHVHRMEYGAERGVAKQKAANSKNIYASICNQICREHGLKELNYNTSIDPEISLFDFFEELDDYEISLDIVELAFRIINKDIRNYPDSFSHATQSPDDAIEELNSRFKEASVGYEFIDDKVIQIDSQFLHSEVVKPVLHLLTSKDIYRGTINEFLSAHSHYRNKNYKECLNDCLKSFESIMKAIHINHSWGFNQNDTAKNLINSCLKNNLIPNYLQTQFASIRTVLESGVPTVRNKEGGHGQGVEVKNIPKNLASYILHLTATNLLFLAECSEKIAT